MPPKRATKVGHDPAGVLHGGRGHLVHPLLHGQVVHAAGLRQQDRPRVCLGPHGALRPGCQGEGSDAHPQHHTLHGEPPCPPWLSGPLLCQVDHVHIVRCLVQVRQTAVSDDGKIILACCEDSTICRFDAN